MRGLGGRTVIVTGGGGGIGGATCRRFADDGARVAVFDIDAAAAAATAASITDAGGTAVAIACDITDYERVSAAVAEAEAALGPTDILVNNAGWDVFNPFLNTTPAHWQKVIAINYVGALNMHHVVLPGMVARRFGKVVNVASDAGRVGSSGESIYAGCKAALLGFSKTLAREHARHNININVVCPGIVRTRLYEAYKTGAGNPDKLDEAFRRAIPMGRLGEPDDLPGIICFLSSEEANYVTGQVISVSGGLTMVG